MKTNLQRIKANKQAYEDFKAWLDHECDGMEESEELAEEYIELLELFNPLNIQV